MKRFAKQHLLTRSVAMLNCVVGMNPEKLFPPSPFVPFIFSSALWSFNLLRKVFMHVLRANSIRKPSLLFRFVLFLFNSIVKLNFYVKYFWTMLFEVMCSTFFMNNLKWRQILNNWSLTVNTVLKIYHHVLQRTHYCGII